jgi:hypothetical protein
MKDTRRGLRAQPALAVITLASAILVLPPPADAWAQEAAEAGLPTELIAVTNVSINSAYTLASNVCQAAALRRTPIAGGGEEMRRDCVGVSVLERESMLSVTATPEIIARIRALVAEFDRLPDTRAFQIVVLAADRSGESAADVPDNVRQALDDVRGFLPYTGFRVLGSGWLRTSRYAEATLPGPMELSAALEFRPTTDPTAPLLIEQFSIYRRVPVEVGVEGVVTQQMQNRSMMESTFTINPGETVVVGTSKLNGDDTAVVVLLTAVRN